MAARYTYRVVLLCEVYCVICVRARDHHHRHHHLSLCVRTNFKRYSKLLGEETSRNHQA